jgi:hypothetical protein
LGEGRILLKGDPLHGVQSLPMQYKCESVR